MAAAHLAEDPVVITQVSRLDQVRNAIRDALIRFPELTDPLALQISSWRWWQKQTTSKNTQSTAVEQLT